MRIHFNIYILVGEGLGRVGVRMWPRLGHRHIHDTTGGSFQIEPAFRKWTPSSFSVS